MSIMLDILVTRYRFRLVSLSCDPNYVFSIDGHTMTVIEADSINTEPLTVDSIQIFAAQRYSFVVRLKPFHRESTWLTSFTQLTADQSIDNYWVRANPNLGTRGFAGGINSAILRYAGAAPVEPTTTQTPNSNPLVETNLHPLAPMPVVRICAISCTTALLTQHLIQPGSPTPGGVDLAINMAFTFVRTESTSAT